MTKSKKIACGARSLIALGIVVACVNSLVIAYGDTLSSYMGSSVTSKPQGDDEDTTYTVEECLQEGREVSSEILQEGSVLLRNENNCLPLEKGSKVTILGAQSYNYINGGTGSAGGKYDEHTYTMKEAFEGTSEDSKSTEQYLDVNDKAWTFLETAVGGKRNADTTGEYVGTLGDGTTATFKGSDHESNKDAYGNGDWGGYKRVCEFTKEVYENHYQSDIQSDGYNDVVIVTFARSGAEGASPVMDYDGNGVISQGTTYLQLSEDEKNLLKFCNEHYQKTILLVNSSAAVELGEIEKEEYGVDACLWIGHPGEAGLVGVAKVLVGEVNPSGKLVDTYAYDHSTMPSFYNSDDNKYTNVQSVQSAYGNSSNFGYYQYEEGIYVGYRFYETADKAGYFDSTAFKNHQWKNGYVSGGYDDVVQYPFGYGLSYTTFTQEVINSDINLQAHTENSITVRVTNEGERAGKQVVQIYMEAPYNTDNTCGIKGRGLEKAAKVLVGFAKTEEIPAKEYRDVTITFDTDDLASFDNYGHGVYVLEQGEYNFHIGENAHVDATDPVKAELASTIIYDETENGGVGARESDNTVAKVVLSDMDAGDGNMLDGYLSRSDFASGFETIMTHESSCKTESLKEEAIEALATPALKTTDYTYQTYENGEKVTKTVTKYVGGSSYQAYATEETWEGYSPTDERYYYDDANPDHEYTYGEVYYLEVDSEGNALQDENGDYIVTTEETSMRLDVDCPVLETAEYDDEIWAYLVDQTTLDEQISVAGGLGWNSPAVESVNKERMSVVDGPGESGNGQSNYTASTWFPSAVVNASTWNPLVVYKMGTAYSHQSKKNELGGAYAPAMNTHRNPYGGRNFEYYSEDGFIAGMTGAAQVAGLQDGGLVVFIKHMAFNDGDTNRDGNITWVGEQAAREIFLKPYEISLSHTFVANEDMTAGEIVEGEGALGIMGSLNRDGISWSHQGLYQNIVRGEWDFHGLVITDGVGPYPWVLTPGTGLMGGTEGQLGGSNIDAYADVEGDASKTIYGQYLLRNVMKHFLYQDCKGASITSEFNQSWKYILIGFDVVAGVGMAAIAVFLIVLPLVKKEKKDEETPARKED